MYIATRMKLLYVIVLCKAVFVFTVHGILPPNIGDVKLVLYDGFQRLSEVQVYFSDGIEAPRWGAICADSTSRNIGKAICRQVGATYVRIDSRSTSTPIWFKSVTCNEDSLHLLHCKYTVVSGKDANNPSTCGPGGHRLMVKCDPEDNTYYNGQIKLCPSDSQIMDDANNNTNTSISNGVVSLFYDNIWRGINLQGSSKSLFGGNEADALCRQMGYTQAVSGSAVARDNSGYTFKECYHNTLLPHGLQDKAWMYANKTRCQDNVPQECFGCCYDFNSDVIKNGCPTCDSSYDLFLSCTFDPVRARLSLGTSGSENVCKLSSKNKVDQCNSLNDDIYPKKAYIGAIASLSVFLFIVNLCIVFVCVCVCCYVCGKKPCGKDANKPSSTKGERSGTEQDTLLKDNKP